MGEHLPCKQGVRSSILLISTKGLQTLSKYAGGIFVVESCDSLANQVIYGEAIKCSPNGA